MSRFIFLSVFCINVLFTFNLLAQQTSLVSKVWVSDNGNGTYTNPVLHADYSDPDAVRVGDDYYMTSSSFNCIPGLPILHSRDLVNWKLINYALPKQIPLDVFDKVQHGGGVWAPCIRYHKNEFYIYYPDPDFGIYMIKTAHPAGKWSEPLLVYAGKGLIDPSPLWDDNGKAYLVYAFAGSRAGIKSVIMINEMSADGKSLIGNSVMLIDGHKNHPTIEGPKIYKRNGYYYIFAPGGGVSTGWQTVLRSKNIFGPYDDKIVMAQGNTDINGPHQGAWVDTKKGEHWFLHFQDKGVYGRVVHLNPLKWINDWPVIGADNDNEGLGEPVTTYKKPNVGKTYTIITPPESDEFNENELGLQWQWHANYQTVWGFPSGNLGFFRINCVPRLADMVNFWGVSNLLMQKFPAHEFTATTKLTFNARFDNEELGFIAMGIDYKRIAVKFINGKYSIYTASCKNADRGTKEEIKEFALVDSPTLYFRIQVLSGAECIFSYSTDGINFDSTNERFKLREGKWIGSKIGYYALRDGIINDAGSADIDWFRIEK